MKSARGLASLRACVDESRGRSGFTLVELLVVISIIAILSVVGITVFTGVQKNARDAKRVADIQAIGKAMEVNYSTESPNVYTCLRDVFFTNGAQAYKDPKTGLNYGVPGCGGANCHNINGNTVCSIPTGTPTTYYTSYIACAELEQANSGNQTKPCVYPNCFYCVTNQQ